MVDSGLWKIQLGYLHRCEERHIWKGCQKGGKQQTTSFKAEQMKNKGGPEQEQISPVIGIEILPKAVSDDKAASDEQG